MSGALLQASRGKGKTYPNPTVGAVVFKNREVAWGFHRGWGKPHAEIEAMRAAGSACKGADLYVTLEPCSHYGKTPPCTQAIIGYGIRRVFVCTRDPNPAVSGKGIRELRRAGIEVKVGLFAAAARRLNEDYFKFMEQGIPFVTLKIAQTIDGKIATLDGNSRWITSAPARKLGKAMRAEAQAVMVGVNTVKKDDPTLLPLPRRKRDYYRCVLDSNLTIPVKSALVRTAHHVPTIVYYGKAGERRRRQLEAHGVDLRKVRLLKSGLISLKDVLHDLGKMGVMHLFVEGGGAVATSLLKSRLVDKLVLFVAPKIIGDRHGLGAFSKADAKSLHKCYGFTTYEVKQVGRDALIKLYPKR
jgi:diaminohydroxyphosphoribosylaminopyrimidine deaminase/5-amino-6-(5-phosphoribosylamino)uracil reductase